ncbi:MAG TPA: hypothetical protein VMD91_17175 [Candidatus Sulfotelmatobacter sp.]|nr:hypothetical protein [Candidatus Sulfotelmatobacter sp.]
MLSTLSVLGWVWFGIHILFVALLPLLIGFAPLLLSFVPFFLAVRYAKRGARHAPEVDAATIGSGIVVIALVDAYAFYVGFHPWAYPIGPIDAFIFRSLHWWPLWRR